MKIDAGARSRLPVKRLRYYEELASRDPPTGYRPFPKTACGFWSIAFKTLPSRRNPGHRCVMSPIALRRHTNHWRQIDDRCQSRAAPLRQELQAAAAPSIRPETSYRPKPQ